MDWEVIKKRQVIFFAHCLTLFIALFSDIYDSIGIIFLIICPLVLYYLLAYFVSFKYIPSIDITMAFLMCVIWFLSFGISFSWTPILMLFISVPFLIYLLALNLIIFVCKYIGGLFYKSGKTGSGETYTCALLDTQRLDEALALAEEGILEFGAPEYSEAGTAEFMSGISREAISKSLSEGSITIWTCEDEGKLVGVLGARPGHISFLSVSRGYIRTEIASRLLVFMNAQFGEADITVNSSPNAVVIYKNLGFCAMDDERTINGIRFVPMKKAAGAIAVKNSES